MHGAICTRNQKIDGFNFNIGRSYVLCSSAIPAYGSTFMRGKRFGQKGFINGLSKIRDRNSIEPKTKIIIYNGVGTGIGDMIMGEPALRSLYDAFKNAGENAEISLAVNVSRLNTARNIYKNAPYIGSIIPIGVPIETLSEFHFIGSTEELLDDPIFDKMNMTDYFINRLGINIPEGFDKKPRIYPDQKILQETKEAILKNELMKRDRPLLFLNMHSSSHRSIPLRYWYDVIDMFIRDGYRVIVSAGNDDEKKSVSKFIYEKMNGNEFVHEGAPITTISFDHLVSFISFVDAVATVDSGILHIAGALKKPCACAFFSINPEYRCKYYPTVESWQPESFQKGKYFGTHRTNKGRIELEADPDFIDPWRHASLELFRIALSKAVEKSKKEDTL